MAVPKTIYQTFKTDRLPFLTKWHIHQLQKRNPEYDYQFYSDERIEEFVRSEFGTETSQLYSRLNLGAAKADFFRYAVLFKKGGIYLDIDSLCTKKLDHFITPNDTAIIALEKHGLFYVQWALIFGKGHIFLEKTLEIILDNIKHNRFPNDVHQMTGPAAFTQAIQSTLGSIHPISYREMGFDYEGNFQFHYRFSKFLLYGFQRKNHWRNQQQMNSVLK
jgi:mannosyltransferase OCH1-like enzyme